MIGHHIGGEAQAALPRAVLEALVGGMTAELTTVGMPSVLVEVSHFSNPKEAARLMDPGYRQKIAQGIFDGVLDYIQSLGKG